MIRCYFNNTFKSKTNNPTLRYIKKSDISELNEPIINFSTKLRC